MSLPEGFTLRRATTDDIDMLVAHRRSMFVDMAIGMKLHWMRWQTNVS